MKIMKYIMLAVMLLGISSLNAQKFGYINTAELIQSIPEVKEANSNIETFRNQLQKKGQDMIKGFQEKYAALEKKRERGELSPKQLEEEAMKLGEEEQQIRQFDQESQQKVVKKSEDLLQPLRNKIQAAIDQVAAENNFVYIFDYSTGFVLYADQSTDVSTLVRAKLGM